MLRYQQYLEAIEAEQQEKAELKKQKASEETSEAETQEQPEQSEGDAEPSEDDAEQSESEMQRALFTKKDIIVFAVLLIITVVIYMIHWQTSGDSNVVARITLDREVVKVVELSEDRVFELAGNPNVEFAIIDGTIAFVASNCFDRTCIRMGRLHRSGQMAACVPNRVSIAIVGGEDEDSIDTIAM